MSSVSWPDRGIPFSTSLSLGASEEQVKRTHCFPILLDHCSDFFVFKQPFFSLSCYDSCFLLPALCFMWDLSSLTGDGTRAPCNGSAVLAAGPPGKPHFSACQGHIWVWILVQPVTNQEMSEPWFPRPKIRIIKPPSLKLSKGTERCKLFCI